MNAFEDCFKIFVPDRREKQLSYLELRGFSYYVIIITARTEILNNGNDSLLYSKKCVN